MLRKKGFKTRNISTYGSGGESLIMMKKKKKKKNQSSLLIIFVAAQLNYGEFRQKDVTKQQRRNGRCSLSGEGKRRNYFA